MSNLHNRVKTLEKQAQPQRDETDIEQVRASIMAKLEAVLNGEVLPEPQPYNPLRDEILQRLERIANEQIRQQEAMSK
jgi:predicted component of type VI protein secretion system